MKKVLLVITVFSLLAAGAAFAGSIVSTAHDLSGAGYGTDELCIFCHTPHNARTTVDAPLWNHDVTAATYTVYSSASLDATIAQPGGVSKACLSCHDGTIAVDSYYTQPGNTLNVGSAFITSSALLGTDLSNDHPIGFDYTAVETPTDPDIRASASGKVNSIYPLYGASKDQMECPTCHDVHDNAFDPFLRAANTGSALCLGCHLK